jgi:deoxyribodipyrimidine photolyase-related protein
MSNLVVILGDQLNLKMSSLSDFNKETDSILMSEVREEATYVKHHKKKIAFVFSAMRHLSQSLKKQGFNVIYIKYDDSDNKGSLFEQTKLMCTQQSFSRIKIAHPGEYRLLEEIESWESKLNISLELTPDNRFM